MPVRPSIGKLFRSQWFYLLLVIITLSIVTTVANPRYLRPTNIGSILKHISVLGLVATGATVLIVSGNFDISVGAVMGLSACVMGVLILHDVPVVWTVLAGLGVAMLCALFVGGASILLRAPSFIVSLACIWIFQGMALALTRGSIQTVQMKVGMPGETTIFGFFPVIFLITLAGFLVMHFILTYTRFGRRVYSIGSNPRAAYLSGISVRRNKLMFFALNGLFVGIAAALLLLRVGSAKPSTGSGYELTAIGAVIVGGAPISGGKGKIVGTVFGVLLIGMIPNVMNMLHVDPYYQGVAFGLLILMALAVSVLSQKGQDLGKVSL
ncbi:MAG: ABC transporter permease [Phycisphaerae bacterium]|jgi:ribose transport system permease protein|nr:ABC transporter permease [Phycisphaerae bacterium]